MLNSCLGLFTAAPFPEHPLFRSYGVNLPSSLTTLLPLALEFSSYLPVSVCGTGTCILDRGFSWQCEISCFAVTCSPWGLCNSVGDLPPMPASAFGRTHPDVRSAYPPASPRLSDGCIRYRNINRLSITYAFRPQLRSRLTLGGRTFPRKP